jgi:hypothetical protein
MEAWGRKCGLPRGYVSDVIEHRRPPSDRMLHALRLRRREIFEPVDSPATDSADPIGAALAALLPYERRALSWLPADGSPRNRQVRDGAWRPGPDLLARLAAFGLAEKVDAGWTATAAGREAQQTCRETDNGCSPHPP